jgi:hypothetical protein
MVKGKKGKSKLFAILGICAVILLITSVIITATGDEVEIPTNEMTGEDTQVPLPESVQNYVEEFVEKKGIDSESINNVTEIDFENLPKEVEIENVDNTNLAIYQINYDQPSSSNNKVFVITYSVEKLETQGDLIVSQDKREFLNFGFNGKMNSSGFLKTAVGVESSLEKGYVMIREGSITGLSTNLEVLEGNGNLEIILYKNGEQVQFGNSFIIDSAGIKKDYDIQSKDIVTFEAGDILSLYVKASDGISWKDVTTLLEITG